MGCFDPPDSPDLPPVVREYHAARREWFLANPWSQGGRESRQATYWRYLKASSGLTEEVKRRGGVWEMGDFTYRTDKHQGQLCIDRVFPAVEETVDEFAGASDR